LPAASRPSSRLTSLACLSHLWLAGAHADQFDIAVQQL
jgi:hypothetical protein